nr:MAG TPA: hypothetical protein [Microviridae sp.]
MCANNCPFLVSDPVTLRWGAPLGGAVRLLGGSPSRGCSG